MFTSFIIARIIEALRDAIAFTKGNADLGFLWHTLKYFQFSALIAIGYFFTREIERCQEFQFIRLLLLVLIMLLGGYIAFEEFLAFFRTIDWTKYNWA